MIWAVFVVSAFAVGLVWPNVWILWTARSRVHRHLAQVPACRVGLVLGCAQKLTSGRDNFYFTARMAAAAQLVEAGKVKRLVVSGGPLRPHAQASGSNVSEVDCMKDALIRLGVSADVIDVDAQGLRTRLSIDRVGAVLSDQALTIVSQGFHTPRAVYLARRVGLQANAFNAQAPSIYSRRQLKVELREVLSRTRAFWER